jgi:hypothetical protein
MSALGHKRTSIAGKTIFKIAAVLRRPHRIFTLAFPAQLIPKFGLPSDGVGAFQTRSLTKMHRAVRLAVRPSDRALGAKIRMVFVAEFVDKRPAIIVTD